VGGGVEERIADCARVFVSRATRVFPNKEGSSDPLDRDDKAVWRLVTRTSNGRQVWRDELTGLIWSDSSAEKLEFADSSRTCTNAAQRSLDITGGLAIGWRLPTRTEYETAIDHKVGKVLPGMQDDKEFWSATLESTAGDWKWYSVYRCISDGAGFVGSTRDKETAYARCVGR